MTRSDLPRPSIHADGEMTVHGIGRARRTEPLKSFDSLEQLVRLRQVAMEVNADLYYQRTAGIETGIISSAVHAIGRNFVFGSSSLWNATINLHGRLFLDTPIDRIGMPSLMYKRGVWQASAIVAQTEQIARLFREAIPKMEVKHIPPAVLSIPPSTPRNEKPYAVSITRLIWYRRPELVVEMAKLLPGIEFVLAGYGPMEAKIREMGRNVPNLQFLGRVAPDEATRLIYNASVCINTSMIEGFPNTLLESLSCGTPYVSFYDPDEVICSYRLGAHIRSISEAAIAVRSLVQDSSEREHVRIRAKTYLEKNHNTESIIRDYVNLFEGMKS